MKKRPKSECIVPRSLGFTLWISRIFGIAPLQIVRKRDGYLIRLSTTHCVYGCVTITIILLITLIALGFDLSVPLEKSTRMRSETRRVVWIADVCLVGVLSYVGGYYAPAQMKRLIDYVLRVQKIHSELRGTSSPKLADANCLAFKQSDDQHYRNVVVGLSLTFIIMVVDFISIMYLTIIHERPEWVAYAYTCYYVSYFIIQLLETQFILTVTYVLSALRLINYKLKKMRAKRVKSYIKLTAMNNRSEPYTISVQPRSVNKVIDTLATIKTPQADVTSLDHYGTEAQMMRHLSLSYSSVCELIREVSKNHGVILLLLLASFLLHLIVTLYYMITYLIVEHAVRPPWQKISNPVLQLVWCGFHLMDLVLLIEPCHRTHAEIELTRALIGNLMCTTTSMTDPLATELDLFSRNLFFNQPTYSPLQVCTLTRSLICTVLGSMTTYLVVIVQL